MNRLPIILGVVFAVFAGRAGVRADDAPAPTPLPVADVKRDMPVSFEKDILPVLSANCLACHNRTKAKADLVLETPTDILKGGESGAAAIPKNSGESLLLKVSAHRADPVMPPKGNKVAARDLTAEELGLIRLWIDQGASGSIGGAGMPALQFGAVPAGLNAVYAAAVTPDGRYAAAARGAEVHVYHLPTRALVARLGGHRDLVQSLAFSPDGMTLASGAYREVRLWRRRRDVSRFTVTRASPGGVNAADVAPDGATFVTAGADGVLRVWDAADGGPVKEIRGHAGPVTAVRFSPDGKRLASASADKTVRVWDPADGTVLAQADAPNETSAVAWVNEGKQLATGGADGIIRVWDVPDGKGAEAGSPVVAGATVGEGAPTPGSTPGATNDPAGDRRSGPLQRALVPLANPKELKGHEGAVAALGAVPGAPTHLLSGGADGTIRRWDVSSGSVVKQVSHGAPVKALAVRPDGKRIASAAHGSIKLWDAEGKPVAEMKGDREANEAAADRDRDLAFAAGEVAYHKSNVDARDKASGEQVARVKQAAVADVEADKALAEKRKARADADAKKAEADAKKMDAEVKAAEEAVKKAAAEVTRADAAKAAAADALRLAIKSAQGAADAAAGALAALQDAEREHQRVGAELAALKAAAGEAEKTVGAVAALAFSADGAVLAAGGGDGVVRTYSGTSGASDETYARHGAAVTAVGFVSVAGGARVGQMVSAGGDGVGIGWTIGGVFEAGGVLGTGDEKSPFADRVTALDFGADGKLLATGGGVPSRDGEAMVWEVEGGKLVRRFERLHSDAVLAVDLSADGKFLATAAADRFMKLSEVSSGRLVKSFEGHTGHVLGVALSRGGRTAVTGGADNTVKVWDAVGGERRKSIPGFEKEVTAVRFAGDGEQFVATGGDGKVRLLRPDGGEVRNFPGFSGFVYAAAVTRDGAVVVAGGEDGTLRAWNTNSGEALATLAPPGAAATP